MLRGAGHRAGAGAAHVLPAGDGNARRADRGHAGDAVQHRAGQRVADEETNPLCGVLKLAGVAKVEAGRLVVRNRIYGAVFDLSWVTAHMPDAEARRQREAYRRGLVRAARLTSGVVALVGGL